MPCIFAGHETKAMLNNNGPRYKRSKLERQMNVDVFWCVIILLVMCLFAAVGTWELCKLPPCGPAEDSRLFGFLRLYGVRCVFISTAYMS